MVQIIMNDKQFIAFVILVFITASSLPAFAIAHRIELTEAGLFTHLVTSLAICGCAVALLYY